MKDPTYMVLNINDPKIKNIADAVTNKTSRKIIDYLTDKKEASESDIVKNLNIAASTVNYNIKQLEKAGLIEEKRHMWSVRGKRIKYYRIARKAIVISPKYMKVKSVMKEIGFSFLISGFMSLIVWRYLKSREVIVHTTNIARDEIMVAAPQKTATLGDLAYGEAVNISQYIAGLSAFEIAAGVFAFVFAALLIYIIFKNYFSKHDGIRL